MLVQNVPLVQSLFSKRMSVTLVQYLQTVTYIATQVPTKNLTSDCSQLQI